MPDALSAADIQDKFIDANGIKTRYLEMGSGQPVVLIHGGGAGADSFGNWRYTLPLYAKHCRAIAVDMLGFGKNEKPDPATFTYSQDARNKHMADFIEALGAGPVHLIGNSMGGSTSTGVAVNRPDLVRKVVLMGSGGIKMKMSEELMAIMKYDYTVEGMRKIVKGLTNPRFNADESLVKYRHELSNRPDVKAAYDATMGWLAEQGGLYYDESFIAKVSHPTLVVHGKNDKVVPLSSAYRFLELIDRSWGYIVPDCGHWAMMEHPEDFARVTLNFLLNDAVK